MDATTKGAEPVSSDSKPPSASGMFPPLELARQENKLWPTVHDALDTFLSGKVDAKGYERIWRLIHVWESIALTLSTATVAKFRASGTYPNQVKRSREICHGLGWNPVDAAFDSKPAALAGNIDQWLEILLLAKNLDPQGLFLTRLKFFLSSKAIDVGPMVGAWERACNVSLDLAKTNEKLEVFQAMKLVNSFRNRFAHVPFPPDPIEALADGLERMTEQLFTAPFQDNDDARAVESFKGGGVLAGALGDKRALKQGHSKLLKRFPVDDISFVFFDKDGKTNEIWDAKPFLYMGMQERVYILTRLKGHDPCLWEFTRFRAEANAVEEVRQSREPNSDFWLDSIPVPDASEYIDKEQQQAEQKAAEASTSKREPAASSKTPLETRASAVPDFGTALDLMRKKQYSDAIPILEQIVALQPRYHNGWLRLGIAKRELAANLGDVVKRRDTLDAAIKALDHAKEHTDPDKRAWALYERSKSYYRSYIYGVDKDYDKALSDAHEALRVDWQEPYDSWLDYLEARRPVVD